MATGVCFSKEAAKFDVLCIYLEVCEIISHTVFETSFRTSQFPHKSVNLFFILVMIKDELTDWCGNDFCKTTSYTLSVR